MTFNSEVLLSRLAELVHAGAAPKRFLVAYSGGVDSTALLHALVSSADRHRKPVVAIHINHGLHENAADWAEHCRHVAAELDVEFICDEVHVGDDSGLGLEAAARRVRYDALRELVEDGDWVLSAHHEDDQSETLLLNLMRGSGLAGLAGIGTAQRFARGMLVRPLLGVSGSDLKAYAEQQGLHWIDDPSNIDTRFDRNFLRRKILPALEQRWPGVGQRLGKSAELAGEASKLLNDLAEIDLANVVTGDTPDRLDIDGLKTLSEKRQRNLLRHAARKCGLSLPPATRLGQITNELIPAREDAQPLVSWPGAEVRRYRGKLYLLAETVAGDALPTTELTAEGRWLDLGKGRGQMRLEAGVVGGIDSKTAKRGLSLRYRRGGEEFCPAGRQNTHKLKKLLQEDGVVPWMREQIPLLYSGDRLVAVGDLWIAASASHADGYGVHWRNRPPLH
ncbi:MAG: tRNA lysidine(34) synthetase TilS [Woeseia sp.]